MDTRKHSTLCWECEKACGRCSWSKSFTPVEGWKATPTKVRADQQSRNQYVDSFDVYECPEFEPLKVFNNRREAKKESIEKADEELAKKIKKMRFEQGLTYREIGDLVGYSEDALYRFFRKLREEDNIGMVFDVVFCKECRFYQQGGCLNKGVTEVWKQRRPDDFCSDGKRRVQNE